MLAFKNRYILGAEAITFMALIRYINDHARHNQIIHFKIMDESPARNTVAWRIHMRADSSMHFNFHNAEFILTFTIRIIYVHVMIKPASTIPCRDSAIKCVG